MSTNQSEPSRGDPAPASKKAAEWMPALVSIIHLVTAILRLIIKTGP